MQTHSETEDTAFSSFSEKVVGGLANKTGADVAHRESNHPEHPEVGDASTGAEMLHTSAFPLKHGRLVALATRHRERGTYPGARLFPSLSKRRQEARESPSSVPTPPHLERVPAGRANAAQGRFASGLNVQ